MRRRRRKKPFMINLLLISITFFITVSLGYSYLSSVLKIKGQVTGKLIEENYTLASGSDPDLKVMIARTNKWQEGSLYKYQYSLKLTNIRQTIIEVSKLTLDFAYNINSIDIQNYNYAINGKTLVITNTNYIMQPNQTVTLDFILITSSSNQMLKTVKLEVVSESTITTLDKFNVNFSIVNSVGTYTYQYNVTVTNKTGARINGWQLDITLPSGTTYISGTSAIFSFNNGILTIKNESYNGRLNNNASTSFGLQLSTNIINFIPNNIRVMVR
jgi:uncharacterized repeat protein (TIGR01451 family)